MFTPRRLITAAAAGLLAAAAIATVVVIAPSDTSTAPAVTAAHSLDVPTPLTDITLADGLGSGVRLTPMAHSLD